MRSYFWLLLLCGCGAEASVEDVEDVAHQEQALCALPTGTAFHSFASQALNIGVTDECTEANPGEYLSFYSPSEPKRWRIDAAAPAPKKPSGQSCSWLSTPMLIPGTPACDMVRSFSCPYTAGTLVYHVILTAGAGDSWSAPSMVMYDQDPSGNVWNGCTRTIYTGFPIE